MSYWFRNEDGSCSYGSINLGRSNDPSKYLIKFPEKIKQRQDDIIKNINFSQYKRNDVYMFLYGHTENDFTVTFNTRYRKTPELKVWNSETICNVDINLFLVAFIVFIDSKSTFSSKLWETLKTIFLLLLNQKDSFFEEMASSHNCSPRDFFNQLDTFISNELISKISQYLNEDTCFTCYTSLCEAKEVLIPPAYDELEKKCCEFFDEIALQRINSKISLPRELDKLFTYSVDHLFFYDDYFKLEHANPETIKHVNDVATFLYIGIAKILINHKYYLQAQNFLEYAKEIYVKKSQLTEIIEIEFSIKKPVRRLQKRKERKETAAHNKRCKLLYRSINKEMVKFILPGGIKQLDCIMKSLFKLIDENFDAWSLDYHKKVFALYSDAFVRLALNPGDMSSVISLLKSKHPSILKTDALSAAVVAFTSSNIMNNQFEIVTDEDLSLIKEIGNDLLETKTPKNDKTTGKQHLVDAEYGLVVTKPIYTTNVKSSYEYLEHLRSLSGERYKWERLGSTSVQGVKGMIDMYEGTLPSGEKSPTIYINMYGSENSHSAPIGFMYVD